MIFVIMIGFLLLAIRGDIEKSNSVSAFSESGREYSNYRWQWKIIAGWTGFALVLIFGIWMDYQ